MIPDAPGTYLLLLSSSSGGLIRVGRLGKLHLQPGWYLYVGSAFGSGGLRARIGHHQHFSERPHWHIDYLRRYARLQAIRYVCAERREHEWAARIAAMPGAAMPMPRFGSSDCGCLTHLFRFEDRPSNAAIRSALTQSVMPRLWQT